MKKGSVAIAYRQEVQKNTLHFTYDALGNKLQKKVTAQGTTTTTDYANGLLYKNGQLQFASHPEGYLEPKANGTLEYVYQFKDDLGNVRMSYKIGSFNELIVVEENNYYPFGMRHEGYNNLVDGEENPYKFLGQERHPEFDLNWDTFRYRNYDYEIARFFGVDPIAEDYASISPYQFAHNNPVWKIELEGLEGIPTTGEDILNQESGFKHPGGFAIPIGDSSAKNYGNATQTITISGGASMYASYPGETVDNLMTTGVQWLASQLTGGDASAQTAGIIEVATSGIILFASKGKGGKGAAKGLGNPFKNKTIGEVNKAMEKQVKTGKLEKVYEDPISGSKAYKNKSGYSYNVDTGKSGKTGKKVEPAHIDVNYPKPKPKNSLKKKLPIKDN